MFVPFPLDPLLKLAWPTPNTHLFDQPERFFARTRANPGYGRPGWTRDGGRRFHKGCDIAPLMPAPTGSTTTVMFTDLATGREYPGEEPTWTADDEVFAVADGVVEEAVTDPETSTYGIHLVIRHRWPSVPGVFDSLYAHLEHTRHRPGDLVQAGELIGRMGTTSSSADARNWMAVAPHLHLEFRDVSGQCYDPEAMLRAYVKR